MTGLRVLGYLVLCLMAGLSVRDSLILLELESPSVVPGVVGSIVVLDALTSKVIVDVLASMIELAVVVVWSKTGALLTGGRAGHGSGTETNILWSFVALHLESNQWFIL
ncbi:hypothetical protein KIN20_028288 [Parelaphostrongylus tenuis]|uniref:Uncharacterized protein n=1 Tax=Parelaphostrongylus tenuis TaxID=148309 RepID=A0AAD5WEX3_PARTN|nr:hypothetical protein KIN20_028288 [Parelaphostrongylus tenuis]